MPTPRRSKPKSPFHYAESGQVVCRQDPERDGVMVEVHFCTVYLTKAELSAFLLSQLRAGQLQWGQEFIRGVCQEAGKL